MRMAKSDEHLDASVALLREYRRPTTTTVRTAPSARPLRYHRSPSSREVRRTASGGGPDSEA
jgi:hypothetical protein